MRRHRFFLPWIAMGVVLALAPHASAQVPTQDSVSGAGSIFGPPLIGFNLDARSGPSGENPTGTASFRQAFPDFRIEGPVTCLTVSGNHAVIGLANTLGSFDLGGGWFVEVTDDTADTFSFTRTASGEVPAVCPPTLGLAGRALFAGDITVIDAPALPTSRDQCRHGGWVQLGFDNRAQCIRSVRRQARQECIFIRAAVGRPAFRAEFGSGPHKRHAMRRCIRERMND
jgi:hypothetical protein